MSAAYDDFDYPAYWIGREYEHKAEILAIRSFLAKIKKVKTILEVGAGYGRLTPSYAFRAKRIILSDPSARTLKLARNAFKENKKIKYLHSSLENLPSKIRSNSVDLVVIVRVLHHLRDLNLAFKIINKVLCPGGYFILEFANKRNLKATLRNLAKGDFAYLTNTETLDIRSKKAVKKGTLPFLNYHPEKIKAILKEFGFDVIEKRSVSNIRSSFFKRFFSTDLLIFLEKMVQTPFSYFNLGPSVFVLSRKKG